VTTPAPSHFPTLSPLWPPAPGFFRIGLTPGGRVSQQEVDDMVAAFALFFRPDPTIGRKRRRRRARGRARGRGANG
jgi:hypothetical protein